MQRCFFFYFLNSSGLEIDAAQRCPQGERIVLLNREDVMAALGEGRNAFNAG